MATLKNSLFCAIRVYIRATERWRARIDSGLQDGAIALPIPLQGHPGPHSARSHGDSRAWWATRPPGRRDSDAPTAAAAPLVSSLLRSAYYKLFNLPQ